MSRFQTHNAFRSFVTTGLVPVVHGMPGYRVDCRDKPGNDGVTGFQSETEVPAFAGMTLWVETIGGVCNVH
ncbi:hypothetical protein [Devosia sp. 2618]|uniref:hypothetical protein n=1 Tax=Devosia sp. 2618 TaxID=3156454 RepID=UPI00339452B3